MAQPRETRIVRVYAAEMEALKQYVAALYAHDEAYDSMVHIEEGVNSLLKNPDLASAYFIKKGEERIGYTILTRYHSVEKGGLTFYIDELYVEEPFRRTGIGREIMQKIVDVAKAAGARGISAQAETYNTAAQEFFRSTGFAPTPYQHFERTLS